MADKHGWALISRKLPLSPMWLAEPFTRGQAWVDLILLTNYEPGHIRVGGERIDLARGQCGWSQVNLAKRWKWSRGKTERYLNELKIDGRIDIETSNRSTVITLLNYNHYQEFGFGDSAPDNTPNGATDGQQTDIKQGTKNKNNKNNKGNNITRPPDVPEQVWEDFLRVRAKKRAPLTVTAMKAIEREAAKASISLPEAIQVCVERSWQGFKADWFLNSNGAKNVGISKNGKQNGHAFLGAYAQHARAIADAEDLADREGQSGLGTDADVSHPGFI